MRIDEIRLDSNGVMLRPGRRDGCVRRRAAEMALPAVKRWMGGDTGFRNDKGIVEELMKHIGGYDGFHIAKSLDERGWGSDSDLVEILDEDFICQAEKELVSQWVKCLGIKSQFPISSQVIFRGETGRVVKHDEALAQYGVQTPDQKDGRHHVCNAEEIKPVSMEAAV